MYGLKKNVDLSFLLDSVVEQICVSNSGLIINFDKPIRITILSTFTLSSSKETPSSLTSYAQDSVVLFPLIGEKIHSASATNDGNLEVIFYSGETLEIIDDSSQFESFLIDNDGQITIV
ncbi:DUF6188 family protein [Rhodanobacter lindaniclasticus]